jgi:hypothetical protein
VSERRLIANSNNFVMQLCDNLAHAPPLRTLPATASKTLSVRANPSKRLHFATTTRLRREAEASYRAGRWQDGWTFEYEAGATECAGRVCLPSTVSKLQHSRSFLLTPQIRTS